LPNHASVKFFSPENPVLLAPQPKPDPRQILPSACQAWRSPPPRLLESQFRPASPHRDMDNFLPNREQSILQTSWTWASEYDNHGWACDLHPFDCSLSPLTTPTMGVKLIPWALSVFQFTTLRRQRFSWYHCPVWASPALIVFQGPVIIWPFPNLLGLTSSPMTSHYKIPC